jgi:hypothetical protein
MGIGGTQWAFAHFEMDGEQQQQLPGSRILLDMQLRSPERASAYTPVDRVIWIWVGHSLRVSLRHASRICTHI